MGKANLKNSQEVEKISCELHDLRKKHDALSNEHQLLQKKIRDLQKQLSTQISPNHFRKTLTVLKEETEKLRTVHPVRDLLTAKEQEVERLTKALASISEVHPDFELFDFRLKASLVEREELRALVAQAEDRLKRQILRIRTAGFMIPFEVESPQLEGEELRTDEDLVLTELVGSEAPLTPDL